VSVEATGLENDGQCAASAPNRGQHASRRRPDHSLVQEHRLHVSNSLDGSKEEGLGNGPG
jgi:hypothetical protein